MVNCRSGPKCASIGLAQESLAGVKHSSTLFFFAQRRIAPVAHRTGAAPAHDSLKPPRFLVGQSANLDRLCHRASTHQMGGRHNPTARKARTVKGNSLNLPGQSTAAQGPSGASQLGRGS
ncbi:hypothetical protein ACWGDT_01910 [Streptomyces avermitilis]